MSESGEVEDEHVYIEIVGRSPTCRSVLGLVIYYTPLTLSERS